MGVRVGVDVGGTFTKAVALDGDARVVARAVVPTTHSHADGVAAGVVEVVGKVAAELAASARRRRGRSSSSRTPPPRRSTPCWRATSCRSASSAWPPPAYAAKARKRTALARIDLTDSRALRTVHEFLDISGGFDPDAARAAIGRLRAAGVGALCVAEAFSPDDDQQRGGGGRPGRRGGHPGHAPRPSCPASTAWSCGRVTGGPQRLDPARSPCGRPRSSQAGVAAVGVDRPGHGHAGRRRRHRPGRVPAGARRSRCTPGRRPRWPGRCGRARSATPSSSRSAARRPTSPPSRAAARCWPTCRSASHATAVRALDVRVVGVAGGSMLRTRRRRPGVRGCPGCLRRRAPQRPHRRPALRLLRLGRRLRRRRGGRRSPRRPATPTTTSSSGWPTAATWP